MPCDPDSILPAARSRRSTQQPKDTMTEERATPAGAMELALRMAHVYSAAQDRTFGECHEALEKYLNRLANQPAEAVSDDGIAELIRWHQAMADEPKRNSAKRAKHLRTVNALRAAKPEALIDVGEEASTDAELRAAAQELAELFKLDWSPEWEEMRDKVEANICHVLARSTKAAPSDPYPAIIDAAWDALPEWARQLGIDDSTSAHPLTTAIKAIAAKAAPSERCPDPDGCEKYGCNQNLDGSFCKRYPEERFEKAAPAAPSPAPEGQAVPSKAKALESLDRLRDFWLSKGGGDSTFEALVSIKDFLLNAPQHPAGAAPAINTEEPQQ